MATTENHVQRLIQETFSDPSLKETDYEWMDDIYKSALFAVCNKKKDSKELDKHRENTLYEELIKRLTRFYKNRNGFTYEPHNTK